MRKNLLFVVMLFVAVFCVSPRVYGQSNASFAGNVVDNSGAVIAGAQVTATSQDTGASRAANTDDTGHYLITSLPIGLYTLRIEFKGFQTAEQKDIKLQVDEHRELDFSLAPASVSSSVEVNATAVAVESANASLGQVITSQEVAELPLNGRDFVQLAVLTPGTTAETNTNSFFTSSAGSEVAARGSYSLSVGGSRPDSTDWLLDGVDDNELTGGGIGIFSSIDSIQEFKVLTYNYSAQYGTRAGPTVLVTTKSGSNQFHGSLFEFFRNTDLDARDPFVPTAGKFNLNQYGGALGGPIKKNKTFFFIDIEQKNQREGIPYTGIVPTPAEVAGDFTNDAFGNPRALGNATPAPGQAAPIINPNTYGSTGASPSQYFQCDASGNPLPAAPNGVQAAGVICNKIPSSLIDPVGQALLKLYPLPTPGVTSTAYNYVSDPVRSLNEKKFDVKLNHSFSTKDSGLARFSYDQANSYVPGGAPGFAESNAYASNQGIINHARNVAIGETHVFSDSVVNTFTFGYNRIFDYITSQGTGSCASATIVPGGIPFSDLGCVGGSTKCNNYYTCGLVSVSTPSPFFGVGDRGYSPFQGGTNVYSIGDSLDIVRGKHDIRVGVDVRINQMNVGTLAFGDGVWDIYGGYTNDPFGDILSGAVAGAIHDQAFNGPVTGRRWKIPRPYVQDDWRLSKDLTVNLGVAWDLTTPISEAHGREANFMPSTGQLLVANQGGVNSSAGVQRSWTAFEPRIGIAWKPFGRDKTAVRGGYAIFHDSAWSMGAQGLWQNPPFFAESDQFASGSGCAFATSFCATPSLTPAARMVDGFPDIPGPVTPATFQGSFVNEPTNTKIGMVQQFNANLEQEVPGQIVLTVGYAGSRGSNILMYGNDLNTAGPSACVAGGSYTLGCGPDGAPVPLPYPNFPYNAIFSINDYGKTSYDSLQVKAETKSARYGIYALIGYTFSHTHDNGLSDGLGSVASAPYFPLPNWQKLDWSLSDIDLDHSFTASVIYDLPFGKGKKYGSEWNNGVNAIVGNWQLGVIEKITSGFPVPLIDTFNNAGNSFANGGNFDNFNRPDQVAGCNPYAANHSLDLWINPACFVQPPQGQLGNAARMPVFGPGFVNTDFSIIKRFALPWEGKGLDFRAEFFNLFNHPQYGMPINDINQSSFGQVISTVNNPRLIQFGLKFIF